MHLSSRISSWNLHNKRVLLRTDYNISFAHNEITDSTRLDATIPTLNELVRKGASIIIATHIGRPARPDQQFSTQHLISWFTKQGYTISFAPDIQSAQQPINSGSIVLLENLRFFSGEKSADPLFAQQLASLADYYVNDSFGTLHNHDTSTTLVPQLFPTDHRTIGLLVEQELAILEKLLNDPRKPFVLIIGGAKASDKIPLIEHILPRTDELLLCPAIVFTFLKSLGIGIGTSTVDEKSVPLCASILKMAHTQNKKIMLPVDYLVSQNTQSETLFISDSIPAHGMGISIGPRTIAEWKPLIAKAGTVFFNGSIGFRDQPETLSGMHAIFKAMEQSSGTTIIAGGDSVAAAHQLGIRNITHFGIGGGAALAFLSGQSLPGLEAIESKK